MKKYDKEIQDALKSIVEYFEKEEMTVRSRQIRTWKRLEYLWNGITQIWWSETAHDWRILTPDYSYNEQGDDSVYYDKSVNVFRAYLESIIAALSSTVPIPRFLPDDADSDIDCTTAKGGTEIASLIYQHNDLNLQWIKALWIYCTQGMVAAYNHTKHDTSFGTAKVDVYKEEEEETVVGKICPNCKEGIIDDSAFALHELEMDEFDPTEDDVKNFDEVVCKNCQQLIKPELQKESVIVKRFTGTSDEPKARQILEVNGGLFVRVPNYARCQEDVPYVAYEFERHWTAIADEYEDYLDDENVDISTSQDGGNDLYGRWGRLNPQYYADYPVNTPTERHWWLRKSAFQYINDDTLRKKLQKKFPFGVHIILVNDNYICACPENLDDHWTLTYNPLSNYIHFDPLGLLLTSVQEITSDLLSLTIQTIEHEIPQTFADPTVLNFDAYSKMETKPGAIYKAKNKTGKSLAEGFHTIQTASLSPGVEPFGEKIQELGQFVSGALPSLWGGSQGPSSRTAAQSSQSKQQAMQRLQTPWKMINVWWKKIFAKSVPAYIKDMISDERRVMMSGNRYINVMIKRSELEGKLGEVELDSSDELPQTWGAIRDTIMQLVETQNPIILEALGDSSNLGVLRDAIGISDFNIPGNDDRDKQNAEIQILTKAGPIPGVNQQSGMPEEFPSIQPEFFVDNHDIQSDVCRDWLVSASGRQCKIDNEKGYRNVLLHLKMHLDMLQAMQSTMQKPGQDSGNSGNQPKLRPLEETENGTRKS